MDTVAFAAVTRRLSLAALGSAGLVAAFAGPGAAGAKNTAKKKLRKKQRQKCQSQVEPCNMFLTAFCEENEEDPEELQECLDRHLPCCDFLANCDSAAFLDCLPK